MPELPEVETIKNLLEPLLKGRTIKSIDIIRDCTVVGDSTTFVNTLKGRTFNSISRIGKFLIFHLSDDLVIISHLRMEGKFFVLPESSKNTYFSRMVFHLDNNQKICYDDSRCFGMMKLSTEKEYKDVKDIAQLGPEPSEIDDVNYLINKTNKSNHSIKSILTDQTIIAGIGNIYADEILFASKVHPLTPGKLIKKEEWVLMLDNAKRILKDAIQSGGSTIRSYHPGKDIDGKFQVKLLAYGKAGEPCPICGRPFTFIKVNGRGTTFCSHCQVKKGAPIKVGIYGKISSGKSTVLDLFSEANYKTISCDDIVKDLYTRKNVIMKVNKLFNIPGSDINKDLLRELVQNLDNKRKLERLIHPLVINEVESFLKEKGDILVAEVPLLYEAKMESMFDAVIAVDVNDDIQYKRLVKRNKKTANDLAKLNRMNARFDENKKKADFVVYNNSDLNELNKEVNSIINKLKSRLN